MTVVTIKIQNWIKTIIRFSCTLRFLISIFWCFFNIIIILTRITNDTITKTCTQMTIRLVKMRIKTYILIPLFPIDRNALKVVIYCLTFSLNCCNIIIIRLAIHLIFLMLKDRILIHTFDMILFTAWPHVIDATCHLNGSSIIPSFHLLVPHIHQTILCLSDNGHWFGLWFFNMTC